MSPQEKKEGCIAERLRLPRRDKPWGSTGGSGDFMPPGEGVVIMNNPEINPRLAKSSPIYEASAPGLFSRSHAGVAAASSELEGPLGARA